MEYMMRQQNLTQHPLSAIELPESDDRFDQELARWFALHRGGWSGTAAELLAAVKARVDVCNESCLQSPRALYAHIESHMQILRSLGIDIWMGHGYPRMISLRQRQDEKPTRKPSSGSSEIICTTYDPTISLPSHDDDPETSPTDSGETSPVADETFTKDTPIAKSDLAEVVNGKYPDGNKFEERVFGDMAEALFAIAEIGGRIREQSLDLKSAIDLVVGRTQEVTRCSGLGVGLLQHNSVVYRARAGVATRMAGLTNLFQCCLRTGETLQLRDAQKHPLVGPTCRREGIKSIIIVPVLRDREVAGALGLLFEEMRSFSNADLMTLELIADVVSEGLSGAAQIDLTQAVGRERPAKPKAAENIEPQLEHSLRANAGPVDEQPSFFRDTTNAEASLRKFAAPESSKPSTVSDLATAPTLLWLALKKAWMRSIRAM
jgi:hypothetical protein